MANKTERQLKELRRLMPWTWDARVEKHPPGEKALKDFENVLSFQQQARTRKTGSSTKACPAASGATTANASTGRQQEPASHGKHAPSSAEGTGHPSPERRLAKRGCEESGDAEGEAARQAKVARLGGSLSEEEEVYEATPAAHRHRLASPPTYRAASATPAAAMARTPGTGLLSSAPLSVLASCPHQAALTGGQFKPTPATALPPPATSSKPSAGKAAAVPGAAATAAAAFEQGEHPLRRQLLQSTNKPAAAAGSSRREDGGGFRSPEPRTVFRRGSAAAGTTRSSLSPLPAGPAGSGAAAAPVPSPALRRVGLGQAPATQQQAGPEGEGEGPCSMELEPAAVAEGGPMALAPDHGVRLLPMPAPPAVLLEAPLDLISSMAAGLGSAASLQEPARDGAAAEGAAEPGAGRPSDQSENSMLHRLSLVGLDTVTPVQGALPPPPALSTLPPLPALGDPAVGEGQAGAASAPAAEAAGGGSSAAAAAAAGVVGPPVQLPTPSLAQPLPHGKVGARKPPRHHAKAGPTEGRRGCTTLHRTASAPGPAGAQLRMLPDKFLDALSLLPAAAASQEALPAAPAVPLFQSGPATNLSRSKSDAAMHSLLTALPKAQLGPAAAATHVPAACPPLFKQRGGAAAAQEQHPDKEDIEMGEAEQEGSALMPHPTQHGASQGKVKASLPVGDKENRCGNATGGSAIAAFPLSPRQPKDLGGSARPAAARRGGAAGALSPPLGQRQGRERASGQGAEESPAAAAPRRPPPLSAWKLQQLAAANQSQHARERKLVASLSASAAHPEEVAGLVIASPPQGKRVVGAGVAAAAAAHGGSSGQEGPRFTATGRAARAAALAAGGRKRGREVVAGSALARACTLLLKQRLSQFPAPPTTPCVH